MISHPQIAVFCHLFYEDTWELVCDELEPLSAYACIFLFNICTDTPDKAIIINQIESRFRNCYILQTSNQGKDIGGKFALIKLYQELKLEADYVLFVHDKKSLQALKSATWKKDLLRIVLPVNLTAIFQFFEINNQCGIIAAKEYLIPEPMLNDQFTGINAEYLTKLTQLYGLRPPDYHFVAGTIFWARIHPLMSFFNRFDSLEIRATLERENVMDNFAGSKTHSWERILSWIFTANGYFLKGI